MEINTIADEDDVESDDKENKYRHMKAKEALYGLTQNFPSLFNIAHPRRSLPVIISHLDEDEALSSCLEDSRNQDMETELENLAQDDRDS